MQLREKKTNPNLFRLKELLGLVIYKGAGEKLEANLATQDPSASYSMHLVEGTKVKMEAADLNQEPSAFEVMNASF